MTPYKRYSPSGGLGIAPTNTDMQLQARARASHRPGGSYVPDFVVAHHGTVITLCPMTQAATDWVAENLPEDAQRLGRSVVIEPRYWPPIAEGIAEASLTVNR